MESNIIFKKMGIYKLHRSNSLDHEKGRPAILIKNDDNMSLIWFGTHNFDNKTIEVPITMNINNVKTFFYSSGITWVDNNHLIGDWINHSNNLNYELNLENQKKFIKKFASFTLQKDPYEEIEKTRSKINIILDSNEFYKTENKNLRIENIKLTRENEQLKRKLTKEKNQERKQEIEIAK